MFGLRYRILPSTGCADDVPFCFKNLLQATAVIPRSSRSVLAATNAESSADFDLSAGKIPSNNVTPSRSCRQTVGETVVVPITPLPDPDFAIAWSSVVNSDAADSFCDDVVCPITTNEAPPQTDEF